jgi:hypothetical protein
MPGQIIQKQQEQARGTKQTKNGYFGEEAAKTSSRQPFLQTGARPVLFLVCIYIQYLLLLDRNLYTNTLLRIRI